MKVLITAYAVNPYKGSEDGTGWNISLELAAYHEITVITRINNRPAIEKYMNEVKDNRFKNLNFLYFDLSKFAMKWKKKIGERGYVLYYYLWQRGIVKFIKEQNIEFDIVHALNFHSDSHPQFLWKLGKPVFWGPIGHHPKMSKEFIRGSKRNQSLFKDRLYYSVKWGMRTLLPSFYMSKNSAEKIFVINSSVEKVAKLNSNKTIILPAVATEKFSSKDRLENEKFTFLSVGRLMYMKGFDLVIEAFKIFYENLNEREKEKVNLKIVGKGEDSEYLKRLSEKLGVNEAVEFIEWVEKDKMQGIYESSSVFVFGSHEGAGMVVPEALAMGLPVVCLKNFGPGELCDDSNAIRVEVSNYNQTSEDFARGMNRLYRTPDLYKKMSKNACNYGKEKFSWKKKAKIINEQYEKVINAETNKNLITQF